MLSVTGFLRYTTMDNFFIYKAYLAWQIKWKLYNITYRDFKFRFTKNMYTII